MGAITGWGSPSRDRLYASGRCKYHGVARTAQELKLIQEAEEKGWEDEKMSVIYGLREQYIDAHKAEILDPWKGKREKTKERKELEDQYEIKFGKRPHHFASEETLKRKLAE